MLGESDEKGTGMGKEKGGQMSVIKPRSFIVLCVNVALSCCYSTFLFDVTEQKL